MMIENRFVNGEYVETIRIPQGPDDEVLSAHPGYIHLESYTVLYKPPEADMLKDKLTELADALPDELAAQHPDIYGELQESGELVPANKRFNWGGKVMKAKVDLWDRADQNPDNAPELWDELKFGGSGYREIPEVITTELAFNVNEIGFWPKDGKHYKAKRNGVVHTPEQYPADWEEVTV